MKFFTIIAAALISVAIAAPTPAAEGMKLKVRGADALAIMERALESLQIATREFDPDLDGDNGQCLKAKRALDSLFE